MFWLLIIYGVSALAGAITSKQLFGKTNLRLASWQIPTLAEVFFPCYFLLVQKVAQKRHRKSLANMISGLGPLLDITAKPISSIAMPGALSIINFEQEV